MGHGTDLEAQHDTDHGVRHVADNAEILDAISELRSHFDTALSTMQERFDRRLLALNTDLRMVRNYVRQLGGRTQALEDEKLSHLTPVPPDDEVPVGLTPLPFAAER